MKDVGATPDGKAYACVCVLRRLQTHDVRGVEVHLDDGPVHRPQQLLHQDLNVPLGRTLRTTNGFMFDLIFLFIFC